MWLFCQAVDFNIFEGMECHGVADVTICQGKVVYEGGELNVVRGSGRYIPTPPFPSYLYGRVIKRDETRKLVKVEREPYNGPVIKIESSEPPPVVSPAQRKQKNQENKKSGAARDLHRSGFELSGKQDDDDVPERSSTRVCKPPGGGSSLSLS